MPKPGVLFYFDIRPCIKRLSINEKGQLFEAILDYGEFGAEPELNGALGIAWDFIKPRLDADSERYESKVLQRQYAVFVREAKKQGVQPMCFDDWASMSDIERHQPISGDIERYPTSTSTSTTNTTPISPSPSAQSAGKGNDTSFSAFWNAYPRKAGKGAAQKAFAKVDVPLDVLLSALEQQKRSDQWNRDGGQYIPYPATWLNQRRWEDEPPAQPEKGAEPADDWTVVHPEWADQSTWVPGPDGIYRPVGVLL